MTPIDLIREEYRLHPREESFQTYLDWHLENGFVFSTPDFFIMGRRVNKDHIERLGIDFCPTYEMFADCWYVHAMAGDISKAWDILPYPLPYIAFERKRGETLELTCVKTERMKRLSHAIPKQTVA